MEKNVNSKHAFSPLEGFHSVSKCADMPHHSMQHRSEKSLASMQSCLLLRDFSAGASGFDYPSLLLTSHHLVLSSITIVLVSALIHVLLNR